MYYPAPLLCFLVVAHDDNTSPIGGLRSIPGHFRPLRLSDAAAMVFVFLTILLTACASGATPTEACVEEADRELRLGFYAYFAPVSHNADSEQGSLGFDVHLG